MFDTDSPALLWLKEAVPWALGISAAAAIGILAAQVRLGDPGPLALAVSLILLAAAARAGVRRPLLVIGGVAYVISIHVTYIDRIAPTYAYTGLVDSGTDVASLAVVSVFALVPLIWLPIGLGQASEVVLWFLYLFGYVPSSVIPIQVLGPDLWRVLPLNVVLAIGFAVIVMMQRVPRARFTWRGVSERRFTALLIALGIASFAFLLLFFGIPTRIPDFVTVYDARAQFGATQSNIPGAGYVVAWAGNVIYPLLLAVGLSRSRRGPLALGIVGELLIYSLEGSKAVLFNILLVAFVYVAIRWGRRHYGMLVVWATLFLVAFAVAASTALGNLWPLAVIVVRLEALPGQLMAYYFDFFSSHAPYVLSHSVLHSLTNSPYLVDPPYLIGALYFHTVVDANANLWADAIANFGLLGVVAFSFMLGGVFWILDSVAEGRDLLVIGPSLALAGFTLANGALLTAILTNGIGLTILLIALLPRRDVEASTVSNDALGRALRPKDRNVLGSKAV